MGSDLSMEYMEKYNAVERFERFLNELETIDQYGGWDESREDMHIWIRKDQVYEILGLEY